MESIESLNPFSLSITLIICLQNSRRSVRRKENCIGSKSEIEIFKTGSRAFIRIGGERIEINDYNISSSMHGGIEFEVKISVDDDITEILSKPIQNRIYDRSGYPRIALHNFTEIGTPSGNRKRRNGIKLLFISSVAKPRRSGDALWGTG